MYLTPTTGPHVLLTKFALQWSTNVTAELTQVAASKETHLKRNTITKRNHTFVNAEAVAKAVYHFGQLILYHKHYDIFAV